MKKSIIFILLLFVGCSTFNQEVRIAQKISQDVQHEWMGRKDVACIDYSNEIQRRCKEQGIILLKQASFVRDSHRALLFIEGNIIDGNAVVIDSTGAMSLYPVRLSELKRVTGYKFHSMKLNQGETYVRENINE